MGLQVKSFQHKPTGEEQKHEFFMAGITPHNSA